MSQNVLSAPRWVGGPEICAVANLPGFVTEDLLELFLKSNGTGCKVVRKWQCPACLLWHAKTIAPDPAGGSSGNGRSSKEEQRDVHHEVREGAEGVWPQKNAENAKREEEAAA